MEFVTETNRSTTGAVAPQVEVPPKTPHENADPTQTFLVERVKGGFFKPTIYSIRPMVHDPGSGESAAEATGAAGATGNHQQRLWARMHFGQKNQYSISGDMNDLNKARKDRSSKFIGKIQVEHPQRVYRGWTQTTHDDTRSHLVTVVYDHERMASVDFKMEVALPVVPTSSFHDEFMNIYREGTQNLHKTDKILVLFQGDDSHNMATDESLKLLKGTAAVVSTKNFNLVKGKPVRGNRFAAEVAEASQAESAPADNEGFMYFGKLSDDKFSCRFRDPIDMATAFMIILSRFDTTQKYD